jgi:hypothetical protein
MKLGRFTLNTLYITAQGYQRLQPIPQNCDPQLQTRETARCVVHLSAEHCDPLFHVITLAYNSPDNITTQKAATYAAYYGEA